MKDLEWIEKDPKSWVLVKNQLYDGADTMPIQDVTYLGGVDFYEGYFFGHAFNRFGVRIELVTRFNLEDSQKDVEKYLIGIKLISNEDPLAESTQDI